MTEREKLILRSIIHNFILTAEPVGSRTLARRLGVELSPASVRNTMADLEDMGLLSHPHTSAGRIPTDMGYRFYVDDLMASEDLSEEIRRSIKERIEAVPAEADNLFQEVSNILAEISRLLSVIQLPDMTEGMLERVEIIRVAQGRVMVIIIVNSGMVNTIMLDLLSQITDEDISTAVQLINQRLSGLKLSEISDKIAARLKGSNVSSNALIRLFMDFPDKIFSHHPRREMLVDGARNVLEQPEYSNPDQMRGIIELIDQKDIIIHLMKDRRSGITVTIGGENEGEKLRDLSVITSTYRMSGAMGTLGIIGPTRMDYSRLVTLVKYTAELVENKVKK